MVLIRQREQNQSFVKVANIFKTVFRYSQIRYLLLLVLLFLTERNLYPSYNNDASHVIEFSGSFFEPYSIYDDSAFVFPNIPYGSLSAVPDSTSNSFYGPGWEEAQFLFKNYQPVSLGQYLFWSMFPDYINDTTKVAIVEIISTQPGKKAGVRHFASEHYTLPVMGKGRFSVEELFSFFRMNNDSVQDDKIKNLINLYVEESAAEGVNHDLAFIQMCHETGFLRFDGTVHPDQNNYCGLGTVNASTPGEVFSSPKEGVRAHIQHLKAYGSSEDLNHELVDQRFYFVKRGTAKKLHELTGKWAADPEYDHKIVGLMKRAEKQTGKPVI